MLSNKPDRQVGHVIKEIFGEGLLTGSRGRKRAFRENRIPVRHLILRTDWELRSQRQRISEIRKWIFATGKAAGMKTILVSWDSVEEKALEEDGADCIVDSVDEILEIMR